MKISQLIYIITILLKFQAYCKIVMVEEEDHKDITFYKCFKQLGYNEIMIAYYSDPLNRTIEAVMNAKKLGMSVQIYF